MAAVVPIEGAAADRNLAPVYPGITDSETLADWDPPFPIDLRRVRRVDEDYWKRYRTTPKAFIPLEVGQRLWRSRYGDRTSVRIAPARWRSRWRRARARSPHDSARAIDPLALGLSVRDVRARGAGRVARRDRLRRVLRLLQLLPRRVGAAARGVVLQARRRAARARSRPAASGRLHDRAASGGCSSREGAACWRSLGSVSASRAPSAMRALMMAGLRTWWVGAVGTTALALHVSPASLAGGAAGALVAAMACIWWTLRGLSQHVRAQPACGTARRRPAPSRRSAGWNAAALVGGDRVRRCSASALMRRAPSGAIDATGAFFGAGALLLVACLCLVACQSAASGAQPLDGGTAGGRCRVSACATPPYRPGRSVLAIAVIASATFILISVDAFRRDAPPATRSALRRRRLSADRRVCCCRSSTIRTARDGREALGPARPSTTVADRAVPRCCRATMRAV